MQLPRHIYTPMDEVLQIFKNDLDIPLRTYNFYKVVSACLLSPLNTDYLAQNVRQVLKQILFYFLFSCSDTLHTWTRRTGCLLSKRIVQEYLNVYFDGFTYLLILHLKL